MIVTMLIGGMLAAAAAPAAPAVGPVKAGTDAWEHGDYAHAVEAWREPAVAGDALAQYNMGQAYRLGRGVQADPAQAEAWFGRAAKQGLPEAEDAYGLMLFQNGKQREAMPWIVKSAERGEKRAQYVYGIALFNGDFAAKDWPKAYAMMTSASRQGLAPASENLAKMDKYIPEEDRQKGLAMAQRLAASAGHPPVVAPPAQPAIRTAEVPPSRAPGASYPAPGAKPARHASAPKPAETAEARQAPVPGPKPAVSSGNWRIQLGAFSDEAKARSLWAQISPLTGGLQPYLVKVGNLTKLQAGGLPDRAAAQSLCAKVEAKGHPCFAVAR